MSVAASTLATSLARHRRSWGVWLLLLVAPVGARFAVADDAGAGLQVAIDDRLPVLDWATIGVCLGVVVATVLLPVAWGYLRANVTRRTAWAVEEVTAASHPTVALGRFGADCAVFAAVLAALTVAGWVLAAAVGVGAARPDRLALGLWAIAAPALALVAAVRRLFDARPWLRGAGGDVAFVVLWLWSLTTAFLGQNGGGLADAMADPLGFVRPLMWTLGVADHSLIIGGGPDVLPGRLPLDVMSGLLSPGYLTSRLVWLALTVGLAALAGVLHRPHTARARRAPGRFARWLDAGPAPAVDPAAGPAGESRWPLAGLVLSEARLIASGRLFLPLAGAAALAGLAEDYRHLGSPAALLLLVFALTAHAGRAEATGLRALVSTARLNPWTRRAAFVVAGIGWALGLALPAIVSHGLGPLRLALLTGGAVAAVAMALAAATRSAFVPRLVLLVGWYGYLST